MPGSARPGNHKIPGVPCSWSEENHSALIEHIYARQSAHTRPTLNSRVRRVNFKAVRKSSIYRCSSFLLSTTSGRAQHHTIPVLEIIEMA